VCEELNPQAVIGSKQDGLSMNIRPALFENREIRRVYDEPTDTWWFSVVDIVQVLTQQADYQTARKYWNKLKERLTREGSQSVTNCHRLKLWLAKVGYGRMQEMANPALSLNRAHETWAKHGRSDKWIRQRMTGQETRNKLTDYWAKHQIKKGDEFAILTNIIHQNGPM
jgi:DNA-damage-inducible protein D